MGLVKRVKLGNDRWYGLIYVLDEIIIIILSIFNLEVTRRKSPRCSLLLIDERANLYIRTEIGTNTHVQKVKLKYKCKANGRSATSSSISKSNSSNCNRVPPFILVSAAPISFTS